MSSQFGKLFTPLYVGNVMIRNRIMSTGHDTGLATDGYVNDAIIAYQTARARGGVGLIVLQVSGIHETGRYTNHILMATDDAAIDGYRRVADAVHAEGAAIFAQLFHPGKEIMETRDGMLLPAYAPSAVPTDRYHVMPRAFTVRMINELISGYGDSARRMNVAGIDGVEIVASHGYLPGQFLNPRANLRDDAFGGDAARRRHFIERAAEDVRAKTGPGFVLGLRISMDEMYENGLHEDDTIEAICAMEPLFDYINVTLGSSATDSAAMHIAPPMVFQPGYVAPVAARLKARLKIPVFFAGRVNQPQDAEAILAAGHADMCGMTRAMIADPNMPNKAMAGKLDDIRACIGCNQSCIGRFQKGLSISCIQNPVTGRELRFGNPAPAKAARKVLVVGGGLAGMKAAVVARQRGHDVTLVEASRSLGGQAQLAQLLPERAEFGGTITNLLREIELESVAVELNTKVDARLIADRAPDVVILATGATPFTPAYEQLGEMDVVQAGDVLRNEATVGNSVVVVDWRSDWVGTGVALRLAQKGHRVRLAVNGTVACEKSRVTSAIITTANCTNLGWK